jgi:lauroyl/myristoyl acyltransferase
MHEPIQSSKYKGRPDGVEELTREVARQFDEAVRRHPDPWMWLVDRRRGADRRLERERKLTEKTGQVSTR